MQILNESGKNSAKQKYVDTNKIDEKYFNEIVQNINSNFHKYLEWFIDKILKDEEISYSIAEYLFENFEEYLPYMKYKDIWKYKNFFDLEMEINKAKELKDKKERQKSILIYKKNNIKIYRIETYEAACKYGANTKWCITSNDEGSYWEKYYEEHGAFYFIINHKYPEDDNKHKIAFQSDARGYPVNIFNTIDTELSVEEFYWYLYENNINILGYENNYTFDKKGNIFYLDDGKYIQNYKYDNNNNLIEIDAQSLDEFFGESYKEEFKYDDRGNRIYKKHTNENGYVEETFWEFDNKNRMIVLKKIVNGNIRSHFLYTYYDNNNLKTYTLLDDKGEITDKIKYYQNNTIKYKYSKVLDSAYEIKYDEQLREYYKSKVINGEIYEETYVEYLDKGNITYILNYMREEVEIRKYNTDGSYTKEILKFNEFDKKELPLNESQKLIIEAGLNSALSKYKDKIPQSVIDYVLSNLSEKYYKYLEWVFKIIWEQLKIDKDYKKSPEFYNNIDNIKNNITILGSIIYIKEFDKLKPYMEYKDIFQYKSIYSLSKGINEAKTAKNEKERIKEGYKLIYNKNNIKIYRIETYEAVCKYGVNTKWCITSNDEGSYWKNYYKEHGAFYFVINNNLSVDDDLYKVAFQIDKNLMPKNVFNVLDKEIKEKYLIETIPDFAQTYFNPLLTKYDTYDAVDYKENLFIVSKNEKYGVIDISGKIIIPVEKLSIYKKELNYGKFSFFYVETPEKYQMIDKKGKIFVDDIINYTENSFIYNIKTFNGYMLYDIINKKNILNQYFDELKYESIFSDSYYYLYKKDNKYGGIILPIYYNVKNYKIIDNIYDEFVNVNYNKVFTFKINNKMGIVDENNKIVIPFIYDDLGILSNNFYSVMIGNNSGIRKAYDDNEIFSTKLGYKRVILAQDNPGRFLALDKDDKFYLVNEGGNHLSKGYKEMYQLDTIQKDDTEYLIALVRDEQGYGYIDKNGNEICPTIFEGHTRTNIILNEDFIFCGMNNYYIMYSLNNGLIIDENEKINFFKAYESLIFVSENLNIGLINNKGEWIVNKNEEKYDKIFEINSEKFLCLAPEGEISKIIDLNGNIIYQSNKITKNYFSLPNGYYEIKENNYMNYKMFSPDDKIIYTNVICFPVDKRYIKISDETLESNNTSIFDTLKGINITPFEYSSHNLITLNSNKFIISKKTDEEKNYNHVSIFNMEGNLLAKNTYKFSTQINSDYYSYHNINEIIFGFHYTGKHIEIGKKISILSKNLIGYDEFRFDENSKYEVYTNFKIYDNEANLIFSHKGEILAKSENKDNKTIIKYKLDDIEDEIILEK